MACTITLYVPLGVVPLLCDGGDTAVGPVLLFPVLAKLQPAKCAIAKSTMQRAMCFFAFPRRREDTRTSPNMGNIKAYVERVRFSTGETLADARVVWIVSVVARCPWAGAEAGENTQFAPTGRLAQENVKV